MRIKYCSLNKKERKRLSEEIINLIWYKKKITDLEYDKSLLLQRNKLLEKEVESLTNKYNALKNELLDIEQHINFCKENQLQIIDLSQKDQINQKEINIDNFSSFKRKIKTLLEYDNNFMEMNSDTTLLNMIIDYIQTIKKENLELRQNLENLNKLNYYNNNNFKILILMKIKIWIYPSLLIIRKKLILEILG